MCRRGASVIQEHVMEKIASDKLVNYVVWLPVLNYQNAATLQRNGQRESRRLPGPRSLHYSDPEGYSGKEYGEIVGVPYGAPAPTYWEHQLGGMDRSRRLNGPRFADEVRKLLAEAE